MPMLNIVCHLTDPAGKTVRYTVKTDAGSSVQQLVDRVQGRIQQPLSRIQRNDRINNEPAHILFLDEPVEPGDEFYFGFQQQVPVTPQRTPPREPTIEPKPAETPITPVQPVYPTKLSPVMPVLVEELQPVPVFHTESSNGSAPGTPTALNNSMTALTAYCATGLEVVPFQEPVSSLTPTLATMTVETVLRGCRKAEVIYEKLKRGEAIMPADRQQLVRTAGRWLMDCCATRMKPTSAERAFFAREFFGKLPNFHYDIKDFHNSQSRGFLDVFIYNERDRKSRSGELNRPFIPHDALVKSLKRKYSKISDAAGVRSDDDNVGPFPNELSVPGDSVVQLAHLDEDLSAFESRYLDILAHDFPGVNSSERLANRWEFTIAPRILSYVRKVNKDFYERASLGIEKREQNQALIALNLIPFLVKRVYKDNSKLSYLIFKLDNLDDTSVLKSMRERNDAGPVIFTDYHQYRIVVMDKVIPCEQSAALALEKLLKAFYVYSLPLSSMRRTLILFILTFFGISRKATSAFKEIVNCILNQPQ